MFSDGKSSVSPQEIKSAIPSVILSIAIGVFMSTTIEMVIFKGQIEKELFKECKVYVASIVEEEKLSMQAEIETLNRDLSSQIKETSMNEKGPLWAKEKAMQDSLSARILTLKDANSKRLVQIQTEESKKFMNEVDFAKRIEAMYNVSSWAVNPTLGFIRMFISLIFIVILISPIISKMMFEDGAYEQLVSKLSDEIKTDVDDVVCTIPNNQFINQE